MRVAIAGLGPIGALIVRVLYERQVEIVAAVDIATDKVGRDVGEVAGLEVRLGVPVKEDLATFSQARPDIAILATTSRFPVVARQALPLLMAGIHVVTTCEEAVFPFPLYPELSREVDEMARTSAVAFLGVGVNPGYMMDYWPAIIAATVPRVDRITVERRVNLSERRARLQEKLGAGEEPATVEARARERTIGHVGLTTSAHLLAHALGWRLEDVEETYEVLVATEPVPWHRGTLAPGKVKGLRQTVWGTVAGEKRLQLVLEMALGLDHPGDTVQIDGPIPLHVHMAPISGDWATASIVANALPRVLHASPGLRTVLDVPPMVGHGDTSAKS